MKNLDIIELAKSFGGVICGSRHLGLERADSDWDVMFQSVEGFEAFNWFSSKNPELLEREVIKEETVQVYRNVWEKKRYKCTETIALDISLVHRILSYEEQLFLHLEKYPHKWGTLSVDDIPEGWQAKIYEQKKTLLLTSEELKRNFSFWLVDQGKI
jgi:hypothetical protein